jgi:hypothetical protein
MTRFDQTTLTQDQIRAAVDAAHRERARFILGLLARARRALSRRGDRARTDAGCPHAA